MARVDNLENFEAKKYTDDQIQKNITKTLGGEY